MTKRVMVVEDNDLNMKLFHDLLEAHELQYSIQTKEWYGGIATWHASTQAGSHPDGYPVARSVSGLEVTKWIKEDDESGKSGFRSLPSRLLP